MEIQRWVTGEERENESLCMGVLVLTCRPGAAPFCLWTLDSSVPWIRPSEEKVEGP